MTAQLRIPDPPRRDDLASLDAYDWREYDAERAEYHALADLRTPAGAADAVRIWQEDGQPDALLSLLLLHRLRWANTHRAQDQHEAMATLDALCVQIARYYVEQMTIRNAGEGRVGAVRVELVNNIETGEVEG